MDNIQLHNADCFDVFTSIPDGSVDLILCDLPYGTTSNKWDSCLPLDKLWEQYERVLKSDGTIVLFAQTPFDKVLGSSNLKMLKHEWIWLKDKPTGFLNSKKCPLKTHENILVFYNKIRYYPQMIDGKPYTIINNSRSQNY